MVCKWQLTSINIQTLHMVAETFALFWLFIWGNSKNVQCSLEWWRENHFF